MSAGGYTRTVGAISRPLAGVVMALALSGTPALLAACALLCVPSSTHVATAAAVSPHAACCLPQREAPPPGHAHHGAHDGAVASSPTGVPEHAPQMAGVEASCCPDAQTVSIAATASGRADGGLLAASPAVAVAVLAERLPTGSARAGTLHPPLRAPARRPLVLRISIPRTSAAASAATSSRSPLAGRGTPRRARLRQDSP